MAGYRPKSLDELNNMYGKTLAAEKAIKKGTDLLANDDFSLPSETEIDAIKQKEQELQNALETAYNAEVMPVSQTTHTDETFKKPEITHVSEPIFVPVETVQEEPVSEETESELPAEDEIIKEEPAKAVSHATETPLSSYRADLMDDYMKIMSDDDDEFPTERKKLSRKEKKKLKRLGEQAKAQEEQEEVAAEPVAEDIPLSESEPEAESEIEIAEESAPVSEEIKEEQTAEELPAEENTLEEDAYEDIFSNTDDNSFNVETEDEEFSFPEDYKPEWMREKEEEVPETESKTSPLSSVFKVLLSLVIVLAIAVASFATTFKCIFSVDTGKAFADTYYAFTAKENYEFADILAGDFVITEKVYAEDGDIFAYVDYDNKTFSFAKRTKSVTNADEIIFVGEKDEDRVLVSRDDSRGVLYATYTGIGALIGLLCDNYIIIMLAAAIVALGASIIIILGFKTKKEKKQAKEKETKKETDNLSEEIFEEEDIFSDIG